MTFLFLLSLQVDLVRQAALFRLLNLECQYYLANLALLLVQLYQVVLRDLVIQVNLALLVDQENP